MNKKNVLIIFGGKSGEHEVSVRSATAIEENIDQDKFNTHVLGITQDGKWHYGSSTAEISANLKVLPPDIQVLLPSENEGATLSLNKASGLEKITFDVIFPIIHGTNGEDGVLQGLLELSNLPYVGSNVLSSAISMDKVIQKMICKQEQIPQTSFVWFKKNEWKKDPNSCVSKIEKELKYPLFVKPANLGSSVGISKVKSPEDLTKAIETALQYDLKVIVEQAIPNIKEVEVAVLGNENPKASVCGSLIPNTEFYDYETKYITDDVKTEIPAEIPEEASTQIRELAIQTFKLLNCSGLARVDFFYQKDTGKFYLNELNTLPGFTSISMYAKLWKASGVSYTELITTLLELAIEKWGEKQELKYTY